MTIQRQFICKNLEGGYTLLTLNEFDDVFYFTKKDKPVAGATCVSREIFGILQRGLLNRKYTKFEGDYIECIDKKYIWTLWLCVGENEVSTERIQKFCGVERYTALRMFNWMERIIKYFLILPCNNLRRREYIRYIAVSRKSNFAYAKKLE